MKVTPRHADSRLRGAERMFVELCLSLAEAGCQIQAICHRDFVERDQLRNQPNITLSFVKPLGTWIAGPPGGSKTLFATFSHRLFTPI